MLLVSGIADLAAGTIELNPTKALPSLEEISSGGDASAQLLAADGRVLGEGSAPVEQFSDGGSMVRFTILIERPDEPIAQLRVSVGDVRTSVDGGETPPVLEDVGVGPSGTALDVEWTAAGEMPLTFWVYYSPDGSRWRSVSGETTETNWTVPSDLVLQADGLSLVLVTASDGVNTDFRILTVGE